MRERVVKVAARAATVCKFREIAARVSGEPWRIPFHMVFAKHFPRPWAVRIRTALCAVISIFTAELTRAQWSSVPAVTGTIVTNTSIYPQNILRAADSAGGLIVAWIDTRAGVNDSNLYAQRLDANGNRRWDDNGTPI